MTREFKSKLLELEKTTLFIFSESSSSAIQSSIIGAASGFGYRSWLLAEKYISWMALALASDGRESCTIQHSTAEWMDWSE
eukprot:scaffold12600_cov172-Skeletonema_dohrnii-CCMP3373.AAC.2